MSEYVTSGSEYLPSLSSSTKSDVSFDRPFIGGCKRALFQTDEWSTSTVKCYTENSKKEDAAEFSLRKPLFFDSATVQDFYNFGDESENQQKVNTSTEIINVINKGILCTGAFESSSMENSVEIPIQKPIFFNSNDISYQLRDDSLPSNNVQNILVETSQKQDFNGNKEITYTSINEKCLPFQSYKDNSTQKLIISDAVPNSHQKSVSTDANKQNLCIKTSSQTSSNDIFKQNLRGANTSQKEIICSSAKTVKRDRRKHICMYCEQSVGNFARHLIRNHEDEFSVQEILTHAPNSLKRKKLLDKLRREGDFSSSAVVPVIPKIGKNSADYIVCKFCKGFYSKLCLSKHTKKCFFNPNPEKRFMAQTEGQTIMAGYFGPHDILVTSGLFNALRADAISLLAKKDYIICEVARRYLRKHKEKHLLLVAKRKMRRLGRLVASCREITNNKNLNTIDILKPHMFQTLILASKQIANYNQLTGTFDSPSLALQIGTLIKDAIEAANSMEIQKKDPLIDKLEQFRNLKILIETDWAYEISSEAAQNLSINKFNKPTLIPMATDIWVRYTHKGGSKKNLVT